MIHVISVLCLALTMKIIKFPDLCYTLKQDSLFSLVADDRMEGGCFEDGVPSHRPKLPHCRRWKGTDRVIHIQKGQKITHYKLSLLFQQHGKITSQYLLWERGFLLMVLTLTVNFVVPSAQLAGIVQPNDGSCNLAKIPNNEFGEYEYTRSLNQVDKLI